MRPAQKAPENCLLGQHLSGGQCCFNEAGAKSAGKQTALELRYKDLDASMRPAQKAPENRRASSITKARK